MAWSLVLGISLELGCWRLNVSARLRFHMPEFPRTPKIEPFNHIKISMRINAQRVRSGEQRRIRLIMGFVFLAIGFLAVAEVSHEVAVWIENRHSAGEIRHEAFVLVLIKTAGIAHVSCE